MAAVIVGDDKNADMKGKKKKSNNYVLGLIFSVLIIGFRAEEGLKL